MMHKYCKYLKSSIDFDAKLQNLIKQKMYPYVRTDKKKAEGRMNAFLFFVFCQEGTMYLPIFTTLNIEALRSSYALLLL